LVLNAKKQQKNKKVEGRANRMIRSILGKKMDTLLTKERSRMTMKYLAIQERDFQILWKGKRNAEKTLHIARIRKNKTLELLANRQLTRENIQEIEALHIVKSGIAVALAVDPKRSYFMGSSVDGYNPPCFFFKEPITQEQYARLFTKK